MSGLVISESSLCISMPDRARYCVELYCESASARCDMLDERGKPMLFDSAHVTVQGVDIMSRRIIRDRWLE